MFRPLPLLFHILTFTEMVPLLYTQNKNSTVFTPKTIDHRGFLERSLEGSFNGVLGIPLQLFAPYSRVDGVYW